MVAIVYSPDFLRHLTGRGHAERPERVKVTATALENSGLPLIWLSPRLATLEELAWVHSPAYLQEVQDLAQSGGGLLDPDTPVSPASFEIARLSAGAWLVGVDQVVDQGISTFVLARPPGHHARPQAGMGFCIFANAALAAFYALRTKNLSRVAILDWDVHHGNGTQEIVEQHPQLAYCSLHQSPCYPGTGEATETGLDHNVLNIPLPPGSNGADYQQAFTEKVLPFLRKINPELLIISAGFDANRQDPLASMALEPEDFAKFTSQCLTITPQLLLGLEGGYHLASLSQSVVSVIRVLV